MKVGILGGSFNPAHAGHLYISEMSRRALNLDQVWWLVAKHNPFKMDMTIPSLGDRVIDANNFLQGNYYIRAIDFEKKERSLQTYYVLKRLKMRHINIKFIFIMGADNITLFHKWFRWRDILKLMPLYIIRRGNCLSKVNNSVMAHSLKQYRRNKQNFRLQNQSWSYLHIRNYPISSSFIREKS